MQKAPNVEAFLKHFPFIFIIIMQISIISHEHCPSQVAPHGAKLLFLPEPMIFAMWLEHYKIINISN
jgi:hypothetical protein